MNVRDKVVVLTGAASGIGLAMARRFASAGARAIVLSDVNDIALATAARELGCLGIRCDVGRESDVQNLVAEATKAHGRIDVFASNAGLAVRGGLETPNDLWDASWRIHVTAHVFAARAVVQSMLDAGSGYFLVTASAAGLLSVAESASYAVTKHAAVAFAEWLAIRYGGAGLHVSCICPQSVDTAMRRHGSTSGQDGVLSPEEVADCVVSGMETETFLILPHPQVRKYMDAKAADRDRWIAGMQKLAAKATASTKNGERI